MSEDMLDDFVCDAMLPDLDTESWPEWMTDLPSCDTEELVQHAVEAESKAVSESKSVGVQSENCLTQQDPPMVFSAGNQLLNPTWESMGLHSPYMAKLFVLFKNKEMAKASYGQELCNVLAVLNSQPNNTYSSFEQAEHEFSTFMNATQNKYGYEVQSIERIQNIHLLNRFKLEHDAIAYFTGEIESISEARLHGTSDDSAISICNSGFRPGPKNMHGCGVYTAGGTGALQMALSYAPLDRKGCQTVFVTQTLVGVKKIGELQQMNFGTAHTLCSSDKQIYCSGHPSMVLPTYRIRLRLNLTDEKFDMEETKRVATLMNRMHVSLYNVFLWHINILKDTTPADKTNSFFVRKSGSCGKDNAITYTCIAQTPDCQFHKWLGALCSVDVEVMPKCVKDVVNKYNVCIITGIHKKSFLRNEKQQDGWYVTMQPLHPKGRDAFVDLYNNKSDSLRDDAKSFCKYHAKFPWLKPGEFIYHNIYRLTPLVFLPIGKNPPIPQCETEDSASHKKRKL